MSHQAEVTQLPSDAAISDAAMKRGNNGAYLCGFNEGAKWMRATAAQRMEQSKSDASIIALFAERFGVSETQVEKALFAANATLQALGPDPAAFESEVAGILMDEGCGNGDECDAIAAKISAALEAMRVKSSGR